MIVKYSSSDSSSVSDRVAFYSSTDADRISDRRYNSKQLGRDKYGQNGKLNRDKNNKTHLNIDKIVNIALKALLYHVNFSTLVSGSHVYPKKCGTAGQRPGREFEPHV